MNKFKLGLSTLAILGGIGLGTTVMTAQASANSVVSQSNAKFGRVTGNTKGDLYSKQGSDRNFSFKFAHHLNSFPNTTWIVSKSALIKKNNGKNYRYYYVTSTSAVLKKSYSGWVWRGYLKTANHVNLNAPYISQQAVKAWMGCESASLLEGLQYKGVKTNTGLVQFMKSLPRSKNNNPNNGFAGSPYKVTPGVFQSILPKPLAKWGNKYHAVKNISGSSVSDLRGQLRMHNPVVVYVTLHFAKAQWGHYFWGAGINNSHVMLLDGYDAKSNTYHVADPNHGKYWVSSAKFSRSYNYKHYAVAIQ